MIPWFVASLAALVFVALLGAAWVHVRRRWMHLWLGAYFLECLQARFLRRPTPSAGRQGSQDRVRHVLLCIADHFEPSWGDADDERADARVEAWVREYPTVLGNLRDSDGRPPRHTFFYPIDQYIPRHVDALASLCRQGCGEVEIHLHHDNDTPETLERTLRAFGDTFAHRHGLLGRWPDGRLAYGFVHGNWALDNSLPGGRHCGVCNELEVLVRTGCYADFTLPAAPSAAQTRTINSIYYAVGRPGRCKSHDRGVRVGVQPPPANALMLVPGPLRLWWSLRSPRPRVENGCIQHGQAPSMARLDQWIRANIHVPQRPDWLFVKLHTHGAKETNRAVLLGGQMLALHQALAARARRDDRFQFHYVTAREMYNLAKAAESGFLGSVRDALDFCIRAPRPDNSVQVTSIAREKLGLTEVGPRAAR